MTVFLIESCFIFRSIPDDNLHVNSPYTRLTAGSHSTRSIRSTVVWRLRAFDVVRAHVKSSRKQLKIIHELRLPFSHNLSHVDFCMQRLISERMWKMNTLELRFTSSHLILRELAAFTNTTSIPTARGSHWGSGRERSHLNICSMGDEKSLMPPPVYWKLLEPFLIWLLMLI